MSSGGEFAKSTIGPSPEGWMTQATDESGFPVASVPEKEPSPEYEYDKTAGRMMLKKEPPKTAKQVFKERLEAEEMARRNKYKDATSGFAGVRTECQDAIKGYEGGSRKTMPDASNAPPHQGFVTKDSGMRHVESTGAVRDSNADKGRFDLIPALPLRRLAQLYQRGAIKYGENNWRRGINLPRYLDSALRHINDFQSGDRAEDHLIAAAWNLFGYVWTEEEIRSGRIPKSLEEGKPA